MALKLMRAPVGERASDGKDGHGPRDGHVLLPPAERRRNFGEALTALRQERGLSQTKLGDLLGVGQSAISSWELAESEPTIDTVYSLESILQVTRPGALSRHLGWLPLHTSSRRRVPSLLTDAVEEDPRIDETVRRLIRALLQEALQLQKKSRR